MATIGERAFAWVGIGVVGLSTIALSVAVIIQQAIVDKQNNQAQDQSSQLACLDNNTEQTLSLPAKYTVSKAPTSLQATDLQKGSGAAAKAGDCLIVKYYGAIATTGKEFDQNFTNTTGFAFKLGTGGVIPGWDQGLVGMQAGGTRRLVIPAELGYGQQSSAAIPANSSLMFVVRLLRIQ